MKKRFTVKDLCNGDVVRLRNGVAAVAIVDTATLLCKDGYIQLDEYNDDLTGGPTMLDREAWDIMAVRRPCYPKDCGFHAFISRSGVLLFERKEVEEMTLEEVCKALGKEIKIVTK